MRSLQLSILAGVSLVFAGLAGCDSTTPIQPTPTPAPWENARIQAGDFWAFSETETMTSTDGVSQITRESTTTVTNETVVDLLGNEAFIHRTEGTVTVDDGDPEAYEAEYYFSQDASGILYEHGEFVDDEKGGYQSMILAADGGKFRTKPYPLTIGTSHEWDATYDDGYHTQGTSVISAIETITIGAGTFVAAKIESEATDDYEDWTRTCTTTRWHVPELCDNIKGEYTCHSESPSEALDYSGTYELIDSSLLDAE